MAPTGFSCLCGAVYNLFLFCVLLQERLAVVLFLSLPLSQYNPTLLSLCREICFLAHHLHKTFSTFYSKTATAQWNSLSLSLSLSQPEPQHLPWLAVYAVGLYIAKALMETWMTNLKKINERGWHTRYDLFSVLSAIIVLFFHECAESVPWCHQSLRMCIK